MIRNVQDGDIKTRGRQFVTGTDFTSQSVRCRLRMFLGESFIDVTKGTPWFQSILGKAPQGIAEVNIKRRIFTAPGVDSLRRFSFVSDLGRRTLSVSATVVGESGQVSEVNIGDEVLP